MGEGVLIPTFLSKWTLLSCTDSPDGKGEKSSYKITANVLLIKD